MNLHELKYLEPKSILDIGANVGIWSKQAKEVWPGAEIFMIEANLECEPALEATGIPYKISLLAKERKHIPFYQRKCGGTSTGDSIYREDTPWYDDENVETVMRYAETLSDITDDYDFYELIKLDTQGSEIDIIKGGKYLVPNAKYIIMEIPVDSEHPPYNIGAPTRKEVLEYMGSIGFKLEKILEDICHPIERYIIQQDVLFIRK